MDELQVIKKAIILYTAVTVIEQLLKSKSGNSNFLYPLKKKRQSNRSKQTNDLMGLL